VEDVPAKWVMPITVEKFAQLATNFPMVSSSTDSVQSALRA
jgi:hypothetical protein